MMMIALFGAKYQNDWATGKYVIGYGEIWVLDEFQMENSIF